MPLPFIKHLALGVEIKILVNGMTNWQRTRWQRELGMERKMALEMNIGFDMQRELQLAERWAATPRRQDHGQTV